MKKIKEELSPITGKPMTVQQERKTIEFRKNEITYWHHYYLCKDSNEQFETPELIDFNLKQIYKSGLSR
jgi:hypothetical protein